MALHIHRQSRFNNHTAHNLYRILVTATSVMGVTKVRNIVPRVGLKPTSLAFWTSVQPFHHVGFPDVTTISMTIYLGSSLPERSVHATTLLI